MDLKINFIQDNPCSIILQDQTPYLKEEEDLSVLDNFKISERVGIDVVIRNELSGSSIKEYSISEDIIPVKIEVEFDGWGTVQHIVIPNKDWFIKQYTLGEDGLLPYYNSVYYSDGTKFYKYINDEITEVTIEEISEINTCGTTIYRDCKDFVSICLLTQCYVDLCRQIFEAGIDTKCFNKANTSDLIYKRDVAWMTINVIEYLISFGQFEEAERILENVGGCNGLCQNNERKKNIRGCGCRS